MIKRCLAIQQKEWYGFILSFYGLDNEPFLFYLSANVHDHTIYCVLLIICYVWNSSV